jgi:NADH:ubiquinone oxidoreductase subunit C
MTDDSLREEMHKEPGDEVAEAVVDHIKGAVTVDSQGQTVVHIPRDAWREAVRFLKEEQQFTQCSDITAVDQLLRPDRSVPPGVDRERFEVVANFLSHPRNRRIRFICQVPDGDGCELQSLFELFSGTELPEREVYDLLGVRFAGHPDLVRLLMPDDWEGHPLRKDDPPARVPVQFKEAQRPR